MADPILELRGLNKSFGPVHVLHDIDFAVYPGEVTALVGDNGAGKSTIVKCVAGIYGIDSGADLLGGRARHDPRSPGRVGDRHRGRLPGPRAGRQPRHHPEHVPRPRDQAVRVPRRRRDGAQGPGGAVQPLGANGLLGAAGRLEPLGRPASDGRDRQGRALEQPGRLPRRAHGCTRRRPDPPGARPGSPPGRPGPRCGADLAQHERRHGGLRPDRARSTSAGSRPR